jgi:cobalt-zinc-cadmium efflux system protein
MAHGHDHGLGAAGPDSRRALGWALALTVAFGVAQIVGSFAFSSLALLADAVHNVSDGVAIGLALAAAALAGLPARGARTFGWKRAEVLAGLVNAVALVAVGAWVIWEAVQRVGDPPDVVGAGVLIFGALGMVANGVPVVLLLRRADHRNINVRAALLHAVADVLGSAGALLAGVIVTTTGWAQADPILGAAIGLLILVSAWGVLREAVEVLLESAPRGVDPDEVAAALGSLPGVRNVHDLHVWTITSGFPALSAHAVVLPGVDRDRTRAQMEELLHRRFGIEHATLQMELDPASGLTIHQRDCPDAPRGRSAHPR